MGSSSKELNSLLFGCWFGWKALMMWEIGYALSSV